jgi:hypothetical protein
MFALVETVRSESFISSYLRSADHDHPAPMKGVSADRLDRLHAHMAGNDWVASRTDLFALGCSAPLIDGWLRSGRLIPLLCGVYGYGRDIETPRSAWRAALLAAGPGSALAGRSACEVWGLVRTSPGIPSRIRIASVNRRASRLSGRSASLARTRIQVVGRRLEPGDVHRCHDLAVMSPPMGVIDFAAQADPTSVKFAFLEACRLGHFGRDDVEACFRRVEGRRGASKVRPLLRLWVPELGRTRSVLEGLFLLAWVARDSRVPQINKNVCGFEVDCLWPDRRLIVELDGRDYHKDPLARARDSERDRILRGEGFRVARFSYRQVHDTPDSVVSRVARLLDRN